MLDDWNITDDELDGQPDVFYAQVIITVTDQVPLFANPRLARLAVAALADSAPAAPGSLWGYIVLPAVIRFIVGPTGLDALDAYTNHVKTEVGARVLPAIQAADDESLDAVLRYNPVRGGALYQVWQAGCHRAIFWTEYKLSNALYELQRVPVAMGLVEAASDWAYGFPGQLEG